MDAPEMDAKAKAEAVFRAIIERSWEDENFKKKLLEDATSALKAEGMPIPDGVKVNVVENSPSVFNFVLPENPKGELSDADLELVAGGVHPSVFLIGPTPNLPPYFSAFASYASLTSKINTFGGLGLESGPTLLHMGPYGTVTYSSGS